ncbi:PREDICTED: DExH-box ATP-dependent RNA helicase DExH7, chloroplastic [Lupinus angustifolius]|uniref:DExH-box ATP-dependent RNA helicase DExH7, chloroplastic n=1 Tax=Lupinus angustifolius TaxID=3871 RepID=UPI00092F3FB5|nr:PREDICTED: DExH-box ATP-dependent RNA helicase DExH7, chloroplastic [Lupinus angustifolius]
MAPKKKKNQNQKAKPPQSSSSSGPKLQISAENENRLRRLLLNSATTTPASDEESTNLTLTKAQKAKKLKSVYEKLSCEGFSNHHIELALSALNLKATFESALDWLCLNIPGNELPLIFSTGFHSSTQGGSVGVISNQPTHNSPTTTTTTNKEELDDEEEKSVGFLVLIKKQHCNVDDTFDSSQADWIRQYVEQNEEEEEEDEYKTWEDDDTIVTNRACEPRSYDVIAKEYLAARLGATKAKEKGDKKGQEQAGSIIRKLKQELSAIGLSDAHLALQHGHEIGSSSASEGASTSHEPFDCSKEESPCDAEGYLANVLPSDGTTIDRSDIEHHSIEDNFAKSNLPVLDVEKDSAEGEAVDIELGDFFLEGVPSNETLPPDILQVQMQEKTKRLYEKNLDKLEGIWKKGDPQKIPKAVLHQLCQKSGWEAPKYHKILDRGKSFSYSVSILRKASGRGKNRKAGGLVTLNLPDQNETFESAEDAQNRVAAYALFQLFPDIPVHFPISEPYALLVKKWMEGESLTKLDDSEEDHRSGFVDSLLNGDGSGVTASVEFSDYRLPHNFGGHSEKKHSTLANHQPFPSRETYSKEMESTCLRQVQNNKMRTQRYQDMLKIRARLPIAALKGNILQLLKEYDALVVCGETGSGKTTQVPQFILDDMIESGCGGHCNIVCTQPRRIAVGTKSFDCIFVRFKYLLHVSTIFYMLQDAQNRVAAYALFQLFPDIPVHFPISEPYALLVKKWMEGESLTKLDDSEEDHRSGFVDSLLNGDGSGVTASVEFSDYRLPHNFGGHSEKKHSTLANHQPFPSRETYSKEMESTCLRQVQNNKMRTQRYQDMLKIRARLPIAALKGNILQLLKEYDALVVCGETGSGKTTQVPQFILDDMIESGCGGHCNIVCTQPRRIAAISVAERVADERCEPSPGSDGSVIGYQVRLDSARNEKTRLLFCTTGILLRKLMGNQSLTGITHIIVDEVHERSLLGDFLLIVLKNLIEKQSFESCTKLKVIVMSATVDSTLFSRYFGHCPVVTAEGRTHPVTTHFLEDIYDKINYRLASDSPASLSNDTFPKEQRGTVTNSRGKKSLALSAWGDEFMLSEENINPHFVTSYYQSYSEQAQKNLKRLNEDVIDYDLLEDLICFIDDTCGEGAILVFLPGVSEINLLHDKLAASYQFGGPSSEWVIPLHSSVPSSEQKRVFLRPPGNIRKVVIATNIAETSITIDDVIYVIDCGKHKESRYNPQKKLSSMVEDWISQANARQRRGRAGRVKPGICFCLYTRHRFEKLMRPYQVPEMLRMPLVELCLQIKLLSLGYIKPFLSGAIDPPKVEAMSSAISLLYEVGALEGDEMLTPLGHHLAKLPVDVLIGKMMLYGAIFGCLSPILSVSAFLSYKSPFVYPKDERQNVERAKLTLLNDKLDGPGDANDIDRQSDHLLMMTAYKRWERILTEKGAKAAQQFCNSFFLSSSVMFMIREMRVQFGTLLADIGLITLSKDYQMDRKQIGNLDSWLSDASQPFNKYAHHSSILKAILCAGLYPNVAAGEQGIVAAALSGLHRSSNSGNTGRTVWFDGRREVHIHPSSINSNSKAFQHPFLVFLEKVETNKVFLRDTSVISPYSILLFGGSINVQHQSGLITIDGWLKLTAPAQIAVLFKELRLTLHSILKELIRKPENAMVMNNEIIKSIIALLLEEGHLPK